MLPLVLPAALILPPAPTLANVPVVEASSSRAELNRESSPPAAPAEGVASSTAPEPIPAPVAPAQGTEATATAAVQAAAPTLDSPPPEEPPEPAAAQSPEPVLFDPSAPSLWPLVRSEMRLEHRLDVKRVRQEIRWLQNNPDFLIRLEPRFQRYSAYIFNELQRRDMPGEFVFLPVIESALDPFAFSPGGAVGLWQFMPATGRRFKLKSDWWVDERRDPVLATKAGLDYLEKLYRRFDDWYLATAAYNTGEGRLQRAIRRAGSRDFFDLRLPNETVGYVPRLLAFSAVFLHPEDFDLTLPRVSVDVPFELVELGSQFDIALAASALGLDADTIYDWNPGLNQWATHPQGPHRLVVSNAVPDAQARLDRIPADGRLVWRAYVVKPGDTLSNIADRFGARTATLVAANGLADEMLHVDETLLIPAGEPSGNLPLPARRYAGSKKIYRVKQGDTLWGIGRRYGVSHKRIMRINHIGPHAKLMVGQRLVIPMPGPTTTKEIRYRVRSGDSLSRIAARFNVSTRDILGWNALDISNYLHPGQHLKLYIDVSAN